MLYTKIYLGFLLLITTFITVAADSDSFQKCAVIKDAKKKMNCYDVAAQQASKAEEKIIADRIISIEAGLVYKSGDIKPVARTVFYLLDDSLANILQNAGLKLPPILSTDENAPGFKEIIYPKMVVYSFGMIHSRIGELNASATKMLKPFHSDAIAAITPHIIQSGTTDFSGKMKFTSIMPGNYYVMGVYRTSKGQAIWNLKIEAKESETSVILDQNNAADAT